MNLAKKIHCLVLCLILIAASCFVSMPALAEGIAEYGTIVNSDNGVNVRSEPKVTSSNRVGGLNTGERVKLLDKVTTSDTANPVWYKIQSVSTPTLVGYVAANYVKEDVVYKPDADFEAYLTAQGFPESYKPMLRSLHANYPNWVFVADHLEMTWDAAVTNESIVGRSLIENSVDDAWKSKEPGAYNWETGKYIGLDGENWVAAHKSVVAYYLDPRNFLNSTDIFQFFMQTYVPELQTLEGLKKIAKNTFLEKPFPETGYATYCDVIMEAAKQSGVSPYVIASMILTEQGTNGQGNSISGTVSGLTGLYNFFNVGASPSSGPYSDSVKNGLYWAKGGSSNSTSYMRPWNTRAKAIIGGAIWYFDEYVNPNTSGGYTIYYKKFDVKKSPYYTFQYMTNIRGAYIEGSKIKKGYTEQELQNSLEFRIPVYKSMPSAITPFPPKTGDNDNYLSSLSVKGHSFTTAFDKWTSEYGVIVDYEVSSVIIEGTKSNSAATVTGLGQVSLAVGINRFNVVVTATSGEKRTYTIVITRREKEVEKPPEPSIETTEYNIGQFITGVDLDTTAEGFIQKLNVKNGTAKLFNADGSEKTSGIVGTGNVVKIYDTTGTEKLSYEVVIYGDVNGDGKLKLSDITKMRSYYVDPEIIKSLPNAVVKAMDVNYSGSFTLADITITRTMWVDQ
ncbi:MAG: SH3 domain-containing protein [Clostridia bacterium]|nr:SH3 domain-containing protein [Clostridia bacterium]